MNKQQEASVKPVRNFYWMWLLPILAIALVTYLVWQNLPPQGETVILRFVNVSGIDVKQTKVQYRGVNVGKVSKTSFTENAEQVEVELALQTEVMPFIREGTRFWLVEPEINTDGVKGIETIVSGPYITFEPGDGEAKRDFSALSSAPILQQEGLTFKIKSYRRHDIAVGASLFYKEVPVGNVYGYELHSSHVIFLVQVHQPYQALVRDNSIFWERSGVDIDVGLLGVSVSTSPLASFLNGGINFATPDMPGNLIATDAEFELSDENNDDWLRWEPQIELPHSVHSQDPEVEKP